MPAISKMTKSEVIGVERAKQIIIVTRAKINFSAG
jgi:hypothetical protein